MLSTLFKTPSIQWDSKYKAKRERSGHPLLLDFYQAQLPDKTTPLNEITFLALDFETTGLNKESDEIITIGMVPFDLHRIYLNQAKHWLVKPQQKLNESSVVIHGITHSDIMNAPDLIVYLPEILQAMQGYVIVAHYHVIERYFFSREVKQRLGEEIEFPIVDTMEIEERIISHNFGLLDRLKGKKKPSVRLGISRLRYSLPTYAPHHALTDAIATAELLQAQIHTHFSGQEPIEHFWL